MLLIASMDKHVVTIVLIFSSNKQNSSRILSANCASSVLAKRFTIGKCAGAIIWWEGGLRGVGEESLQSMEEQPVGLVFPTDSQVQLVLEISHVEK